MSKKLAKILLQIPLTATFHAKKSKWMTELRLLTNKIKVREVAWEIYRQYAPEKAYARYKEIWNKINFFVRRDHTQQKKFAPLFKRLS